MKAIIFAAGSGSRLKYLTKLKPKCMLEIDKNLTLIQYQINILKKLNIPEESIYIIGGYKINKLKDHLKKYKVKVIFNEKFDVWNNIYTFYLIKNISKIDEYLILNSDTFFHIKILEKVLNSNLDNFAVIDTFKTLADEEMKVKTRKNIIQKFGKDISPHEAEGEYIGIAKFKRKDTDILFDKIEKLLSDGKVNLWYEQAFNYVTDRIELKYIDTDKFPWIEIDTPEDYKKAVNLRDRIL